jgi:hypothetical protein
VQTADKETIEKLHQALDMLPRPAMIQHLDSGPAGTCWDWLEISVAWPWRNIELVKSTGKINYRLKMFDYKIYQL